MAGEMQKTSNFEAWYSFYPNKKAKGDARKAYEKAEKEYGDDKHQFLTMLMVAVKAQVRFRQQQQGTGVFVPSWRLPATWIRSESWADEVDIAPKDKKTVSVSCQTKGCANERMGPSIPVCETCYPDTRGMTPLLRGQFKKMGLTRNEGETTDEWNRRIKNEGIKAIKNNLRGKKNVRHK